MTVMQQQQLRIILDARTLDSQQWRGIGRSLFRLYCHVALLRPQWQVVLVHRGISGRQLSGVCFNAIDHRVDFPGDRWDLWGRVRLPVEAWRLGGHVLHAPANVGPELSPVPVVLTVHDTIGLENGDSPANAFRRRHVARAARRAARILTPSRYSRQCLIDQLGVEAEKIIVCPWAADPDFHPVTDSAILADVRRRYSIDADRPYVLAFGAADPRKNSSRLIEAWSRIRHALRRNWTLLLVGIQPAAMPRLQQLARQSGLEDSVLLRGFVPTDDAVRLLCGAELMAYPSLCEGFGLPVLEAFACGTPVLSSNVSSIPEVAADAALLVDPANTAAIASGLETLMDDKKLRRDLAARGHSRNALFTWSACAATTCQALEAARS